MSPETMNLLIFGYVMVAGFSALCLVMGCAAGMTDEAKGARDLFSSAIDEIEEASDNGRYYLIPLTLAVIAWFAFFLGPIYLLLWSTGKIFSSLFKRNKT